MMTNEKGPAAKTPVSLLSIRSSLWGIGIVLAGAGIGAAFGDAVIGVAVGILASSAVSAYLERGEKKAWRFWMTVNVVAMAWILVVSVFSKK